MAESIMSGLFGITPEEYQAQKNQQTLAQSAQLAQQDPFTSARTSLIYGGRQLVGALGAQDPMLQKISAQNQILQGLDITNPQSISTGIERAQQAGIPELAFKLVAVRDEAVTRQQKQLAAQRQMMAQRIAMGAYDQGQPERPAQLDVQEQQQMADQGTAPPPNIPAVPPSYDISRVAPQLMALGPEGIAQLTTAKAAQKAMLPETQIVKEGETIYEKLPNGQFRELISGPIKKESFTGDYANASMTLFGTANISKIPQTPEAMDAITKQAAVIAQAKRPVTNISSPITVNMQKGFGENLQETITGSFAAGRTAGNTIGTIQNMRNLLDQGVKTGFGQGLMLELGTAGQLFNPNFQVKGLAGQEAFQAYSNQVILPEVKKLGVNPTDSDLKFIVQGSPNLSKTPAGNRLLLDALELKLLREQDLATFSNNWLAKNSQIVKTDPIVAQTRYNTEFANYTTQSPLYGQAVAQLRQKFNDLGGSSQATTPATSTLQRGGFVTP
jgi:hypothetical protein